MIEKLVKGRYLEFGVLPSHNVGLEMMTDVQEVSSPILFLGESDSLPGGTPIAPKPAHQTLTKAVIRAKQVAQINLHNQVFHRQRSSQLATATSVTKIHRTLMWLDYHPGKVTLIRAGAAPVLTGPMSGCWITAFSLNGVRYIAHIGTSDGAQSSPTAAAKAAWAALRGNIQHVTGFNPARNFPNPTPGKGACYAVVTPNHEFYAMYLVTDGQTQRRLITGVRRLPDVYPQDDQI